jgi:hypothetical protein
VAVVVPAQRRRRKRKLDCHPARHRSALGLVGRENGATD